MATRSGGQLVVDVLKRQGVDRIFGVPGESFLAVLDALVDAPEIAFVVAKQEGGAAMMADADGKLTGRPGVVLVTRGPGATNAYSGIHVAFQDSTPLVLLVGLIGRGDSEREAFQEIDLKAVFGTQAKWVATIEQAARVPELLSRAFQTAISGRPGPVVIGLPEDMLRDLVESPAPLPPRAEPVQAAPRPQDLERLAALLAEAERPLAILGGETWDAAACEAFRGFAEAWSLPVACAFRCQDRFPAEHPLYAGDAGLGINPRLAQRIREADLLLAVGARLGDCTTSGYSLLEVPVPAQRLVHVHPDPDEIGRVYVPTLGIASGMGPFTAAAAGSAPERAVAWGDWARAARADFEAWQRPTAVPGAVNLGEVVRQLGEALPAETIVTNGAGNYTVWVHRFHRYGPYRSQLAPTSGSMGYGLPAAVAAKLRHPERPVVCFAGDGCFQMTMQEFGTACEYGAAIVVVLCNNGMYGTIRMHQERHYPGRVSGTGLANPDFVALARSYGAFAARVEATEGFAPALAEAVASGRPALIELAIDPEALTPKQSLSQIREAALAG